MDNGFYGPRSRENARLLLDAAKELGYPPSVVKTARNGYTAPQDVIDIAAGISDIEEGKTYPAPDDIPTLTNEVNEENKDEADKAQPVETKKLERPNNGASREDWKNYAESIDVVVEESDKRDGIIEKVDAKEGSN